MSETHHSVKTYWFVFAGLMALLITSVVVSWWDLGVWNLVIALAISAAKALLVMLYFMHLLDSPQLVRVVAVGGLLWLLFLGVLTFSDYRSRGWDEQRQVHYRATPLDRPYSEPSSAPR